MSRLVLRTRIRKLDWWSLSKTIKFICWIVPVLFSRKLWRRKLISTRRSSLNRLSTLLTPFLLCKIYKIMWRKLSRLIRTFLFNRICLWLPTDLHHHTGGSRKILKFRGIFSMRKFMTARLLSIRTLLRIKVRRNLWYHLFWPLQVLCLQSSNSNYQ